MIHDESIGLSVRGVPIRAYANFDLRLTAAGPCTLLLGGMHGDERAPVPLLLRFIAHEMGQPRRLRPTVVIPLLNPDGYNASIRYNARGVDLNRNFPHNWSAASQEPPGPASLSEPESAALARFVIRIRPDRIVNLHWALSEIDADGAQSAGLATALWAALCEKEKSRYRLRLRSEGDETPKECPGSVGQWCGYGLVYPDNTRPAMITLELPWTTDTRKKLHPLPGDSCATIREQWERNPSYCLRRMDETVRVLLRAACV